MGFGEPVAPADGVALGEGAGLDAPGAGEALELADALGIEVAVGEPVELGDAEGAGVGLPVALAGLLAGAVGDFPEPPLPPSGNADCLVEAPTAVSTPTVMAKTRTASPATATQRRRRAGIPRRRLVHRTRFQPLRRSASITSAAPIPPVASAIPSETEPSAAGNGSSGSCTAAAASGLTGRVGAPADKSARRAATAMRRNRSFVVCSEARYRVDPTEATMLAMAAPINVPATPNVEEMTAAETAARALAATCVKLGLMGRDGPDVEETMIGVKLLLF